MFSRGSVESKMAPIKIALVTPWRSIHPGLQHTATADIVLSNQFEALIGTDEYGSHVPLGAKSWEVNSDLSTYKFEIDTSRRYSDGSHLVAADYKRAWEDALRLEPESSNSSLADVLFMLMGSENFEELGFISGIETPDEKTLILKFKHTFRAALDYLVGNRYAAYKDLGGKYIGTGAYQIQELTENKLLLTPNPFSTLSGSNSIEVVYAEGSELSQGYRTGEIEALVNIVSSKVDPQILKSNHTHIRVGQESVNEVMYLNALDGRPFSDKRLRMALQFLIHKELSENLKNYIDDEYFRHDPQLFLPLQMGRIDEKQGQIIISEGEKYIPILREVSNNEPFVVYYNSLGRKIIEIFKKYNIAIDINRSKEATMGEIIENHYKTFKSDIAIAAYSVTGTDPDGAYHMFGAHGAISSPMIQNLRLGNIMEAGRSITDQHGVDTHYKKASIAFLEEAPVIHLGYSRSISLYRSDRLVYDKKIIRRNEGHLYPFVRK